MGHDAGVRHPQLIPPDASERKRNPCTRNHSDDVDLSAAAEQSSEDDEAQDGNVLAEQEQASQAPETGAIHVEGGEPADEDIEINDPEADAIVNDALNIDETAEVEAAAEVLNDDAPEADATEEQDAEDRRDRHGGR